MYAIGVRRNEHRAVKALSTGGCERFRNLSQCEIRRPKGLSPLSDAVCFVDHNVRDAMIREGAHEFWICEDFRVCDNDGGVAAANESFFARPLFRQVLCRAKRRQQTANQKMSKLLKRVQGEKADAVFVPVFYCRSQRGGFLSIRGKT